MIRTSLPRQLTWNDAFENPLARDPPIHGYLIYAVEAGTPPNCSKYGRSVMTSHRYLHQVLDSVGSNLEVLFLFVRKISRWFFLIFFERNNIAGVLIVQTTRRSSFKVSRTRDPCTCGKSGLDGSGLPRVRYREKRGAMPITAWQGLRCLFGSCIHGLQYKLLAFVPSQYHSSSRQLDGRKQGVN